MFDHATVENCKSQLNEKELRVIRFLTSSDTGVSCSEYLERLKESGIDKPLSCTKRLIALQLIRRDKPKGSRKKTVIKTLPLAWHVLDLAS